MADTPGVIVQNLDKIREFIDSFPVIKKYAAQVEQSTKVNYGEEVVFSFLDLQKGANLFYLILYPGSIDNNNRVHCRRHPHSHGDHALFGHWR